MDDAVISSPEPNESRGDSTAGRRGGIFDYGFDVYRTVTDDEYRSVLLSGMIVLDANIMLDLYRYHESTREELLDLLAKLGDRLWIPNHAMTEFWKNRTMVLDDPKDIGTVIEELAQQETKYKDRIRHWAGRVGLPPDLQLQLLDIVTPAFDSLKDSLREFGQDGTLSDAGDTSKDPVVARLSSILDGRIGAPTDVEARRRVIEDARQRVKDNRPPGNKDAGKSSNAAGDCLVWFETLQEAKRRRVDVLFVTRDVKEDWWRIEHGQAKGPHPELAREMREVAGVRLFMLRPDSLLFHAADPLSVKVSDASVKDVVRVTTRSTELGTLEMLAETEESLPRLNASIIRLASIVDQFNQIITAATPMMAAASMSSEKLAVATELADKLSPITEMFASEVMDYIELVDKVDPGTREMIRRISYLPPEQRDPSFAEYLQSVRTLSNLGLQGMTSMMEFHDSIGGSIGFSSKLDVPLKRMQSALVTMASKRSVFERWQNEVNGHMDEL